MPECSLKLKNQSLDPQHKMKKSGRFFLNLAILA